MKQKCLLAIITLSIAASATAAPANTANPKHHYQVVIIGAGIAGLETAHYLKTHGVSDFIILEARNRIGGRAWTLHPKNPIWDGAYLDMGAKYIHGAGPDQPIMQLAKKLHLNMTPSNYDSASMYRANGSLLPDESENKYIKTFKLFEKYVDTQHDHITKKTSKLSISDAALKFIKKKHLSKRQQAGFLYEISSEIEQEYAADITHLSMLWFNSDEEFDGPEMILTKGYQGIVNYLAQGLSQKIHLNSIVKKINYRNNTAIRVTTSNGSIYTGRYVVTTLPIGVLKKGVVKFIPRLPKAKRIAIHKHINMGTANKVFLVFPSVFWSHKQFFERIPNAYWTGKIWKNKGRWIEFENLHTATHKPIICAIISADFAKHIQTKSNKATVQSIMTILRGIYGPNIPNPSAAIISRWGEDPFAYGSYPSLHQGALEDGEDYVIMGKPVKQNLLFAGGGTTAEYPGTIHGAFLTGLRAAKYIVHA